MGVAYVRGLAGDDLSKGVASMGKHFAGYSACEGGHNFGTCHVTPRDLRDNHLFSVVGAAHEVTSGRIVDLHRVVFDGVGDALEHGDDGSPTQGRKRPLRIDGRLLLRADPLATRHPRYRRTSDRATQPFLWGNAVAIIKPAPAIVHFARFSNF